MAVGDVVKKVVSTPWWPAGTEKKYESIGIISHGFVYMTAMMEINATFNETEAGIISDVRDIARAAGADLADLVDCFINAPRGKAAEVRSAFLGALPWHSRPALTVAEMPGEAPIIPTSATCIAALPSSGTSARREVRKGASFGVAARGLLHTAETHGKAGAPPAEQVVGALKSVKELVQQAGGRGLEDVVDCLAVLPRISDAPAVRTAFDKLKAAPALTIVQGGLEDPHHSVALRCVTSLETGVSRASGSVAAAERFLFASGIVGRSGNGTDALAKLDKILRSAGSQLADVVNCMFFLKDGSKVADLFEGFYEVFNEANPPPPTRAELVAESECADCELQVKCVAALRRSPSPEVVLV